MADDIRGEDHMEIVEAAESGENVGDCYNVGFLSRSV
jgi:hypothetical protein